MLEDPRLRRRILLSLLLAPWLGTFGVTAACQDAPPPNDDAPPQPDAATATDTSTPADVAAPPPGESHCGAPEDSAAAPNAVVVRTTPNVNFAAHRDKDGLWSPMPRSATGVYTFPSEPTWGVALACDAFGAVSRVAVFYRTEATKTLTVTMNECMGEFEYNSDPSVTYSHVVAELANTPSPVNALRASAFTPTYYAFEDRQVTADAGPSDFPFSTYLNETSGVQLTGAFPPAGAFVDLAFGLEETMGSADVTRIAIRREYASGRPMSPPPRIALDLKGQESFSPEKKTILVHGVEHGARFEAPTDVRYVMRSCRDRRFVDSESSDAAPDARTESHADEDAAIDAAFETTTVLPDPPRSSHLSVASKRSIVRRRPERPDGGLDDAGPTLPTDADATFTYAVVASQYQRASDRYEGFFGVGDPLKTGRHDWQFTFHAAADIEVTTADALSFEPPTIVSWTRAPAHNPEAGPKVEFPYDRAVTQFATSPDAAIYELAFVEYNRMWTVSMDSAWVTATFGANTATVTDETPDFAKFPDWGSAWGSSKGLGQDSVSLKITRAATSLSDGTIERSTTRARSLR